jgi:hypothetical protein
MNAWDCVQVKDLADPHHGIAGYVVSIDRTADTVLVRLDSDGSEVTFKTAQLTRLSQ